MGTSLKQLMRGAREYAKADKWDVVDKRVIPGLKKYNPSSVAAYLPPLFASRNDNLRDLAGTIAAAIDISKLPEKEIMRVRSHLQDDLFFDKNPYARFRAAVALVRHGIYDKEDKKAIRKVFKETKEKDLRELAERYEKKLK